MMAGTWVRYDPDTYALIDLEAATVQVFSAQALEQQQADLQQQLAAIPTGPTDEELLAWARAHYPMMDYSAQTNMLQGQLAQVEGALAGIAGCTAQVLIVEPGA